MLELGRRANREAQLDDRISCFQGYLPGARLPQPDYEIILSSSLLHHLAEPGTLWDSLRQLGRPGTRVFVMDLLRPGSTQQADRLVERYAGDEPDILRQDFRNSLCAAYTPDEISAQLRAHRLHRLDLEVVSDRHFIVHGRLPLTTG
jgi:SAM-dependent methyltransferase